MTKRSKYICLFLLLFQTTFASTIFAQKNTEKIVFRLAGIFGNNMVLQRETDAAVWGYAKPGATVTIKPTWSEEAVTTTANEDGKWKTTIATPEAGGPFQIGFHSNNFKINLVCIKKHSHICTAIKHKTILITKPMFNLKLPINTLKVPGAYMCLLRDFIYK